MTSGNNQNIQRLIHNVLVISVFTLCTGFSSAFAEDAAQHVESWSVNELMGEMAQVEKSKATFVERKYLSMLKEPLKFSGQLEYTAPSKLVKFTLRPTPERMVLDQDKLEVQRGTSMAKHVLSLQEYPAIWALVESMRSTLSGDVETLYRFYQVDMTGTRGKWRLKLLPLDGQMQGMVSEILISGNRSQINTIEIHETGGDYSVMEIREEGS